MLHSGHHLLLDVEDAEDQLADVGLMRDGVFDEVVHGLGSHCGQPEADESGGDLPPTVAVSFSEELNHNFLVGEETSNFFDDFVADLPGSLLEQSPEQAEQYGPIGLVSDAPLHIFHLVVPIQQMLVFVAFLLFQHLESSGHGSLVVRQPGPGHFVVIDFEKVGEESLEVLTRLLDNRAHAEKHNPEILILSHEEPHSQVLQVALPSVQQFVGDVEAGQIPVFLIVLPHRL